ncbi:energy transducer TonB [Psychrobacter sanguinis]|uniref:energy transducer TonB n=1 Tax=Psychrobacter sanguinis TaxID=861445 RepID=UPI002A762829|nr:energy transducer TonB [Psychrobacter sanguinis]MDY3305772.1 energy transducer TonB [Psychrobacter sanguinis]
MTEEQAKEYYARTFAAKDARWRVSPIISIPPLVRITSKPGTQYRVTLKLLIDKHGNIIEATLLKSSGNRQLDASAINAVKQAKLNPFMENGEAVMGQVFLPIQYIMQ